MISSATWNALWRTLVSIRDRYTCRQKLKLNRLVLGGTQGPNIFSPQLEVACCLPRSCPCVPFLSVVLGLPLLFFPSDFHSRATAQSLFTYFLRTGPIQHYLFLFTSSLIGPAPAISSTSLFGTCCCHPMQKILLRQLVWKMSSFFCSLSPSTFHSHRDQ